MDTNKKKLFCKKTVTEAWKNRKTYDGIICHSDAESQCTSKAYKKVLGQLLIVQDMSDVGKHYDNCRVESLFAPLKKGKKLYHVDTTRMTVEEVKKEAKRYFFACCNIIRISIVNGELPPTKHSLSKNALLKAE